MKKTENYYLGLDIGTSSLGWAVTTPLYDILKFNGKYMWGSRMFPEAKTSEERRFHRSSRRRIKRRNERIKILEMFFATEISKVDPDFFQRLKDSRYYKEDKMEKQENSLFHDRNYKDKDFYNDFPTIYHLRKFLMQGNQPKDIRFLYLAIHHLFLHRGHFLFPDMEIKNVTDFRTVFEELKQYLYEETDLDFEWKRGKIEEVESIIKNRDLTKSQKEKEICAFVQIEGSKIDKQRQAVIGMFCGCKKKFFDLFQKEEYKEITPDSLSFAEGVYEDRRGELESVLGEDILCLDLLKTIYDWGKLSDILQGEKSISIAKVKSYEDHQEDLKNVKYLLEMYAPTEREEFFRNKIADNNYNAYISRNCSKEDLNKRVKQILESLKTIEKADETLYNNLLKRSSNGLLFPKQLVKDNGVIPYQIHKFELEKILEHMEKFFPMLKEKTDGKTVSEKLMATFTFRIPYYVGPLNDAHDKAWIAKKSNTKIYPWNFEEVVDLEESAEKFIQKLTNKCTYLPMEDVLPKSSLLYSKFMVLNELNNLKLNNEPISLELKQKIYQNLFQKHKKVTFKKLRNYLKSENIILEDDSKITGVDEDFKGTLSSYIDFRLILGEKICTDRGKRIVEDCIRWITLYAGEKKLLKNRILSEYKEDLEAEEIQKIVNLRYKDWGRLSRAFLQEIQSPNLETGEIRNIIQFLWETNLNLMQLLNTNFNFLSEIEERNSSIKKTYDFNFEDILGDTFASSPVKRMIWQSLRVIKEIKKITKKDPEKIFIEVAREKDQKKERKSSRRKDLIQLYKSIKDDPRNWVGELEEKSDADLRIKKFYLYYTQMGKCMYSGESISYAELLDNNIYDIDHIYPQSKTKDDSIQNLVLVKKKMNAEKGDHLVSPEIQKNCHAFWSFLHSKKFISDKKFERLTRKTDFTDEELSGFIARQLVETRHSTKMLADILKRLLPEAKIIYVKAGLTSDFRKNFEFLKGRDINDYHHAHDAYLNIITGNVYNKKFTDNPRNFIQTKKEEGRKYNLKVDMIFSGREKDLWNPKVMLPKIEDFLFKKRPQLTKYSFEQHGGFFDQNIVSKKICENGRGHVSIKASNPILLDTAKYGGYNNISGTYFFLVEHCVKGERIRTIEMLPLYIASKIKTKEDLQNYCIQDLKLHEPDIRYERIKYNSLLKINGYPYHITGKTNNSYWVTNAVQPIFSREHYHYLRIASIYSSEGRLENKISVEMNKKIYDCFVEKLENTIYRKKMSTILQKESPESSKSPKIRKSLLQILKEEEKEFIKFDMKEQVKILLEILTLIQANNYGADLEKYGAGKKCGITSINKNITSLEEIILVNQSITGLFENFVDLKKV